MYQIEIQSRQQNFVIKLLQKGPPESCFLTFSCSDRVTDLLEVFHFCHQLHGENDFFDIAEKLLSPHITYILFALYLNHRISHEAHTSSLCSFVSQLRSRSQELEDWLRKNPDDRRPLQVSLTYLQMGSAGRSQTYLIQNVAEYLDFLLLLLTANVPALRICEECDSLFLPRKRERGKLCNYPKHIGPSCTEVRCRANQKRSLATDPLLNRYQKLYKRTYTRFERDLLKDPLSDIETPGDHPLFKKWQNWLHGVRRAYTTQKISPEDFAAVLQKSENFISNLPPLNSQVTQRYLAVETELKMNFASSAHFSCSDDFADSSHTADSGNFADSRYPDESAESEKSCDSEELTASANSTHPPDSGDSARPSDFRDLDHLCFGNGIFF